MSLFLWRSFLVARKNVKYGFQFWVFMMLMVAIDWTIVKKNTVISIFSVFYASSNDAGNLFGDGGICLRDC